MTLMTTPATQPPGRDCLLVLSGGMDSTTMLHQWAPDRIALAVTFTYGANHNAREAACAQAHCRQLGVEWLQMDLGFMGRHFRSALLEGPGAIPLGEYDAANMASTVVPFRNGVMLAVAAGLAESRGLTTVMLANHSGDHSIYPDCRPGFVQAMDQAIRQGTGGKVRLWCPYTSLTKGQIAAIGRDLGMDYSTTYSCYRGGERHCGRCGTCLERRQALAEAGIPDNTLYEDEP